MATASDRQESNEARAPERDQTAARLSGPAGRGRVSLLVLLLCLPLLLYLAAPILGMIPRTTFRSYVCCWQAESALRLSLFTASISLLISIVIGTPVAYWLAHYQFRGKDAVDTLIDLPLVLPPVAAGLALFLLFGMQGFGQLLATHDLRITFTRAAVIMAQVFVSSPFYVKQARAGFEAVPRELRLASATLGAGPLRTFFRVTVPLASHALVAGAVMTWARALGEFGATLMFAGAFPGRTETMPVAIYSNFANATSEGLRTSIALAVVLVAVSFLVIILARRIAGRSIYFAPTA